MPYVLISTQIRMVSTHRPAARGQARAEETAAAPFLPPSEWRGQGLLNLGTRPTRPRDSREWELGRGSGLCHTPDACHGRGGARVPVSPQQDLSSLSVEVPREPWPHRCCIHHPTLGRFAETTRNNLREEVWERKGRAKALKPIC